MLQTTSMSVPLEVLNQRGEPISRGEAHLIHLHSECAVLQLDEDFPQTLLHWGTHVRFWMSDGPAGYMIDGVVVSHKPSDLKALPSDVETTLSIVDSNETLIDAEGCSPASETTKRLTIVNGTDTEEICGNSAGVSAVHSRDIVLRVLECHPFNERRTGPRRWRRFGVRYCPLDNGSSEQRLLANFEEALKGETTGNSRSGAESTQCWERAWAVDLSAGGIRLRTFDPLPMRQLIALQFWLPGGDRKAASDARSFLLRGRVLRSSTVKARASAFEAMIAFDRLSAEDGLALSEFISQ